MTSAKNRRQSIFISSYKLLVLMGFIVAPTTVLGYVQHHTVAIPNKLATLPSVETVHTAFIPHERSTETTSFLNTPPSRQQTQQRVKYDLGLGKNPSLAERKNRLVVDAVANSDDLASQLPHFLNAGSVQEAVQNWFDYEAVRDFPAPLSSVSVVSQSQSIAHQQQQQQTSQVTSSSSAPANSESVASTTKKPAKSFPILKPQRSASDVLRIQSNRRLQHHHHHQAADSSEKSLPFMSRIAAAHQKHQHQHHNHKVQLDPNTVWVEMLLHHQLEQQELSTAMAMV